MPEWLQESLRLWPMAVVAVAFVWGYLVLFLDEKIRKAINGKIEKAQREILETVNGQGRRISDVKSQVDRLQGRVEGQDAALARHGKNNEENPALGYTQHARDLVTDLERLVVKAKQ